MQPSGTGHLYLAFHRPLATYRGEDLHVFPEALRDLLYGGTHVINTEMFTAELRCDSADLQIKGTRTEDGVTCFEATFPATDVSHLFQVVVRSLAAA